MLSKTDCKLFEVAKSICLTSDHHKARIGAVVAYKGDILGVGKNRYKTHPKQLYYNKFRNFEDESICRHNMHAELDAILKCNHIPIGSKIYIYRLHKTGILGNCRPCKGCMQMLKDYAISDIYYTTDNGLAYEKLIG